MLKGLEVGGAGEQGEQQRRGSKKVYGCGGCERCGRVVEDEVLAQDREKI